MTQQDLDFESGIHRTTISAWERGKWLPSIDYVLTLCDALECQPSELFQRAERHLATMKRSRKRLQPPKRGRPPGKR